MSIKKNVIIFNFIFKVNIVLISEFLKLKKLKRLGNRSL
jgi:hypothetical protein